MHTEENEALKAQPALPASWPPRQRAALIATLTLATLLLAALLLLYIRENSGHKLSTINGATQVSATISAQRTDGSDQFLQRQADMEVYLERRAQILLDDLLGQGRSVVRVAALMDPAISETTREFFDPDDPVIRSEQLNQGATGAGQASPAGHSQELVSYEISKTTSRTLKPAATVRRLSASVLVDEGTLKALPSWIGSVQRPEDDPAATKNDPARQGLAAIKALVATALGMDPARGDSIVVLALPLVRNRTQEMGLLPSGWALSPKTQLTLLLCCLLLTALALYQATTIRNMKKQRAGQISASEAQTEQKVDSSMEQSLARLRAGVRRDPLFGAHVLKSWLNGQV